MEPASSNGRRAGAQRPQAGVGSGDGCGSGGGGFQVWIDEQIENNPRRLLDEDVQSKVAPPAGVSLPSNQPNLPKLSAGFTYKAERWNSRASMVGFFSLLFVELVTRKGLLELMGLQVGNGLGFEF